ncbi:MAG: IPT/TIG domain-containing protein [Microscillaceae bacterium]|nr:IPT/TIG domain-containing protein [Microscillaceae bacterium]
MSKTKQILLILLCLCGFNTSFAETFPIPNGDITALRNAILGAFSNVDALDTIQLAPGGVYTLTEIYANNSPNNHGAIGLPAIKRKNSGDILVIEGNGAKLERAANAPAFRLLFIDQQIEVYINNLTFENGLANNHGGGAILARFQSRIRIDHCKFIRNEMRYPGAQYGAAIDIITQCNAIITNCEFIENKGRGEGGCIYNVLSELTVENCQFYRNQTINNVAGNSLYVSGAGIFVDGSNPQIPNSKIKIKNCHFEDNFVGNIGKDQGGGGAYVFLYDSQELEMDQCSFINNQSGQFGGGLFVGAGTINSSIANTNASITNCLFQGNETGNQGGGLWLQGQRGLLANCTFVDNTSGEYGGGIVVNTTGTFNVNHCTVIRNFAQRAGGGVFSNSNIGLNNSIVAYNTVGAGGYYANCRETYAGVNVIEYPVPQPIGPVFNICSNNVIIQEPKLGTLQDNGGPTQTVGLLSGSPAIDAVPTCLADPITATDARGVVRGDLSASGITCDIGAFELSTAGVAVNTPANLQAIAINQNTISISWVDNSNNETGFLLQRSIGNPFNFEDVIITTPNVTSFQDEELIPNTTYYYRIRAEGGNSEVWSNLSGTTTFSDRACNTAGNQPVIMTNPNIIVGNGTPQSCTPEVLQSALNNGGRIICNCGANPLTFNLSSELRVTVNNTILDGGGLITLNGNNTTRIIRVNEGVDFTLQNITLTQGRAPGSGGLFAESGGAILVGSGITGNGGGELKLINSNFVNNSITNLNTAERGGGAVYTYRLRNFVVSACTFSGNSANVGGAIGGIGSQLTLINSDFTNNDAAGPEGFLSGIGGAIYVDGIDLWDLTNTENHAFTICGTNFSGNEAKHEGGAIYAAISDSKRNLFEIDRSTFSNNRLISTVNGNGGAVFHVEDDYQNDSNDPTENLIITNSTFNDNSCQRQGGAIWTITGGGALIENCTFEGNRVTRSGASLGGALAISSAGYGGDFLVRNNTFANNASAHFAGAVFGSSDNNITVSNNIFSQNTSEFEFEGHQLAGPANFSGAANILYPKRRYTGTIDSFAPDTASTADPLLLPLGANGGPTATMPLADESIAIDNPSVLSAPTSDQRGLAAEGIRDIGAYEFGAPFNAPPVISDFSPITGPLRAIVTIQGEGFNGATAVAFNNKFTPTFFVIDDNTIIATVPDDATTGKITIVTPFGVGGSVEDFTVNIPPPTISSFTPDEGGAGTVVTIVGSDFLGAFDVKFNNLDAFEFTIISSDTILATLPEIASDGPISISTNGGTAVSEDDFYVYPGILSFTPDKGGDDTEVVITGTKLGNTTDVKFINTSAYGLIADSTLVSAFVTPGTPVGAAPIMMVVDTFNIDSGTELFTIIPPPTINGFNPPADTAGAVVTLTGINLVDVTSVEFNGAPTTDFFITQGGDSLLVVVPFEATTGRIKLINPAGSDSTDTDFTVIPTIVGFFEEKGGNGSVINIIGTNLVGSTNPTNVTFGGVPATSIIRESSNLVKAAVGTGATGFIEVVNTDGTATSQEIFTFVPPPVGIGFTPTIGDAGTLIKIYGNNLFETRYLEFGGQRVGEFEVDSSGTLDTVYVELAENASTGLLVLTTYGGVDTVGNFTVVPSIFNFTPAQGGTGATITINGANLSDLSNVTIGGLAAASFNKINNTRVTAVVGGGASGPIEVINNNDAVNQKGVSATNFLYIPNPTITSFSPTQAPVGTSITIQGTNFIAPVTVSFNGVNAATINIQSDTQLTVILPPGATTGKIRITNDGGGVQSITDFVVLPDPPTITNINPNQGQISSLVTINGTNLSTSDTITFDGVLATFTVLHDGAVSVEVPDGVDLGQATVVVKTASLDSASTPDFEILEPLPAVINNFTPTEGRVGTLVTINGAEFRGVSEVLFNGVPAVFTIVNNSRIRATVPNLAQTGFITLIKPRNPVPGNHPTPSTEVFTVPFIWTAAANSDDWNDPNNWSPTIVPDSSTHDVIIEPLLIPNPLYPVIKSGNDFTVGNIEIENGATMIVDVGGALNITKTITNAGNLILAGTVRFRGINPQDIPASVNDFTNLTIDNPQYVTLLGNIQVCGDLDMTQGHLYLNGREINLKETGMIVNESETSRVQGAFGSIVSTKNIANTPGLLAALTAGTEPGNLGAKITLPVTTGVTGIMIRRGHARQGDFNEGIERFYNIDLIGSPVDNLGASLDFEYFDAELANLAALEIGLILYRFNGITWESPEGSTVNTTANVISLGNIVHFSSWTAGLESLPLPVRLLSFEAQRQSPQEVLIEWHTSAEINNKSFELQKSPNTRNYQSIATLEGAGTTSGLKKYRYLDIDAQEAAYYRLKQIGFDDRTTYGPVIFVPSDGTSDGFYLYPNPTQEEVSLNLSNPSGISDFTLILTDVNGVALFSVQGDLENVNKQLNQKINQLPQGAYLLRLSGDQKIYQTKLIVK